MTLRARVFDGAALELFARKGREVGPGLPQTGEANGVKVRRIMQLLFERRSLVRALDAVGFSSVLECHAPREPMRRPQRVTLVARKGHRAAVAAYPWVNGKSEAEIETAIVAMAENS